MQNEEFSKPEQLYEITDETLREHVSAYLENSRKLIAKGTSTSIEKVQSQQNTHLNDTRISWFREEISKKTKFDQGKPGTFSKVELTEINACSVVITIPSKNGNSSTRTIFLDGYEQFVSGSHIQ